MFEILEIIVRSLGLKNPKHFFLILLLAGLVTGFAVWISMARPE